MTKRQKTILFIGLASLFSCFLTIGVFLVFAVLLAFIMKDLPNPSLYSFFLLFSFGLSILVSAFIYKRLLFALSKKIDFDAHFESFIKPHNFRKR